MEAHICVKVASSRMSAGPLFSSHWHRVRDVRARLADDVLISRHVYRKRISWVLHRQATGTIHRLDAQSFELIDRLDGAMSVGEIWEQALEQRNHEAPTQDAWMHLLADLHAADLLIVDSRVPVESLFERREKKRTREQSQRYFNPLYLRFALIDPDEWLNRLQPLANALFSRIAFILWATLMVVGCLVLFTNTERLVYDAANAAQFRPYMATLFLLAFPPLKLIHELGHGLAIKRCGGEVHEMGIALLVVFPIPYVDASVSSLFKNKNDRMLVSAAGILVELSVAAVGVLLWASSTSLVGDIGLVLLLTAGLSTLLINGNPLLKFDGYYLLADWLEIPNLQARSKHAVGRLLRRGLSGKHDEAPRPEDPVERQWLLSYGVMSGIYRTALTLSIAWMLSERWFVLGVALALFALYQGLVIPLWRGTKALFNDTTLRGARSKVLALSLPLLALAILMLLPLPHASVTRGVVWMPEQAVIRAASVCQVSEVMAEPGAQVQAGDALFRCVDDQLDAEKQYLEARVVEIEAELSGVARTDKVSYSKQLPELAITQEMLDDVQHRLDAEQHRATVAGRFDVNGTSMLLGRAFARGEVIGYTIAPAGRTIRLAFGERKFADVDDHIERIEVRIQRSGLNAEVFSTSMLSRSPRVSQDVPSAALSSLGGGPHAADPEGDGRRLLSSVVDIELNWPETVVPASIGKHVSVRFVHLPKPLAGRLIDTVKRAFMNRKPV